MLEVVNDYFFHKYMSLSVTWRALTDCRRDIAGTRAYFPSPAPEMGTLFILGWFQVFANQSSHSFLPFIPLSTFVRLSSIPLLFPFFKMLSLLLHSTVRADTFPAFLANLPTNAVYLWVSAGPGFQHNFSFFIISNWEKCPYNFERRTKRAKKSFLQNLTHGVCF